MKAEPPMEPAPCLLLLLFLGSCLAGIDGEGELRCYCNEAGCVSTGYMCKSPAGRCYTAVELQGDSTRATHGCLDSVPLQQRGLCGRSSASTGNRKQERHSQGERLGDGTDAEGERSISSEKRESNGGGGGKGGESGSGGGGGVGGFPLLICCEEDMCNYIENIDVHRIATLVRTQNVSLSRGVVGTERGIINSGSSSSSSSSNDDDSGGAKGRGDSRTGIAAGGEGGGAGEIIYSKNGGGAREDEARDLWFKAAVIAVPIAGGFILVLLVLLAVRMLRTDTQRHRRLVQVRRERSLTKAQLYVTDHFSDVSVTPAAKVVASREENGSGSSRGQGLVRGNCPLAFPPVPPSSSSFAPSEAYTNYRGSGVRRGEQWNVTAVGGGGGRGGGGGGGKSWRGRDVSITVDRNGRVYEKVPCDVSIHRHRPPPPPPPPSSPPSHLPPSSVVRWGNSADFATVV